MMENLDLTKILKDVPKGTKLYSTICGEIYFDCINCNNQPYPIQCHNIHRIGLEFTKEGKYLYNYDGECVLFPSKDQRDWNKFNQFKIGDVIYHKLENLVSIYKYDDLRFDVSYYFKNDLFYITDNLKRSFVRVDNSDYRLATDEEKELFYNELQKAGYFWNGVTNSLEKYNFKVGDKIYNINTKKKHEIVDIIHDYYILENKCYLKCSDQDKYTKEKFNVSTLKPYDKVLVRRDDSVPWEPQIFSFLDNNLKSSYCYKNVMIGGFSVKQCIPYEGNEYLIGTTIECNDYYKTWN